jgi:hypothetical protein
MRFSDPSGLAPWDGPSFDGDRVSPEAVATMLNKANLASWLGAVDARIAAEQLQKTLDALMKDPEIGKAIRAALDQMEADFVDADGVKRPGGYRETGFYVWQNTEGKYLVTVVPPGPFNNENLRYEYSMPVVYPTANPGGVGVRLVMQVHSHPSGQIGNQYIEQYPRTGDFTHARNVDPALRAELYAVVTSDGYARFYDGTGRIEGLDRALAFFTGYRK